MNKVQQIIEAIESEVSTTLGASYSKLNYIYDIEKNSFKGNPNKFGVLPLESSTVSGVVRASTIDQTFQIVLTDEYRNTAMNDLSLQEAVKNLYDKLNDIEKQLYKSKLGLPSVVLLMNLEAVEAPEVIEEHKVVSLRGNFLVKYRTII